MDRPRSPIADRRALSSALRELRERSGLSLDEAASQALDASGPKLSRIETGKQVAGPRDVRDLCRLYGVVPERTDELISWAASAREPGWWESYDVNDDDYVGLESAAARIEQFESSVIPGLLQTREYAETLFSKIIELGRTRVWTRPEIDEWLEIRDRRQRIMRADSGVQLSFVVDEAALLRAVGGPQSMRAQLEHLRAVAAQPNIELRVLPFAAGASPGQRGGFTLLTLPVGPDVAYVETQGGFLLIDDQQELTRIRKVYEMIRGASAGESETGSALNRAIGQVA